MAEIETKALPKTRLGDLPKLKILLNGPSGAGKTALVEHYTEKNPLWTKPRIQERERNAEPKTRPTIGVDLYQKTVAVNGDEYLLNFWDTAGQERFRAIAGAVYRDAFGVIIVFDVTCRASFESLAYWFAEAKDKAAPAAIKYLVGNKVDKAERAVSQQEARDFARAQGMSYSEVSAATGFNVKIPFTEVVQAIVQNEELMNFLDENKRTSANTVNLAVATTDTSQSSCSC